MVLFYIAIFILSCLTLSFVGKFLVDALIKIAKFLQWREFVLSFFVMAMACSLPNLFAGIIAALKGIPEISLGDVVGGNVIDLTIALAIPVLVSKGIEIKSRVAQRTSLFTMFTTLLPLFLLSDGKLGRGDGILLIGVFVFYLIWLFSKEERFKLVYDKEPVKMSTKGFFLNTLGMALGVFLLVLAAEGIIKSASFFAQNFNISLPLVGILIVGLGNALPETYFGFISAKKEEDWLVLGNLMGSVVIPTTLVLGVVSIISPIEIINFSPFIIALIFLFLSSIFFFFSVRTDRRITMKEGIFLLIIYILFLISQILFEARQSPVR